MKKITLFTLLVLLAGMLFAADGRFVYPLRMLKMAMHSILPRIIRSCA